MKKTVEYILIAILALLCIYTAYKTYTLKGKVEYITVTDTIQLSDTITQWQPYDIYHYRTDTAYLPIIDTLVDTVTDTVLVQIPIEIYRYDTTIIDTNYTTHLRAVLTGFHTSIDTLTIRTEIIHQESQNAPRKWYDNIVPAVGIVYGTGGQIGVFAGVGYKI